MPDALSRRAFLGVLGGALAPSPAAAQAARLEEARREGQVVWYTPLAVKIAERVAKLFEQQHSGVKVEVHRSGAERLLQRLLQEAQAGIKNCDVFETADSGHVPLLKRRGMLAGYAPPGADRFVGAFRDKDAVATAWRAFAVVIQYNAKLVAKAEAPRTWKDLLEPKWKGKLVTAHPGYAGSALTQIHTLAQLHGWDFWKQLAQQKPMLVQSIHDPFQVVTAGERAIGINGADYYIVSQRKTGHPVEVVYPSEGVPFITIPIAVLAEAPHPNGARLFIDFVFGTSIQQLLADEEALYVPNPEVTYPADRLKLRDLKLLIAEPEELERRGEEIKRRFVELFGA